MAKRNRVESSFDKFMILDDLAIEKILAKAVEQDGSSYGSLILSSKAMKEYAERQEVGKKIDLWRFKDNFWPLSQHKREKLQTFAAKENIHAQILLGAHLYFNEDRDDEGIELMKKATNSYHPVALYIFGIMLTNQHDILGPKILISFMQQNEPRKQTILGARRAMRDMMRPLGQMKNRRTKFCKEKGVSHWAKVGSEVEGQLEFEVTCPLCTVDVETYKASSGFE